MANQQASATNPPAGQQATSPSATVSPAMPQSLADPPKRSDTGLESRVGHSSGSSCCQSSTTLKGEPLALCAPFEREQGLRKFRRWRAWICGHDLLQTTEAGL